MSSTSGAKIASIRVEVDAHHAASPEAKQERLAAVQDIVAENSFELVAGPDGPYDVILSNQDNKLAVNIVSQSSGEERVIGLSMAPLRRVVRDYLMICNSYYEAVRTARPEQIETIDMTRRSIHNDGAELLEERLKGKVETDLLTTRRIFTLICALFMR